MSFGTDKEESIDREELRKRLNEALKKYGISPEFFSVGQDRIEQINNPKLMEYMRKIQQQKVEQNKSRHGRKNERGLESRMLHCVQTLINNGRLSNDFKEEFLKTFGRKISAFGDLDHSLYEDRFLVFKINEVLEPNGIETVSDDFEIRSSENDFNTPSYKKQQTDTIQTLDKMEEATKKYYTEYFYNESSNLTEKMTRYNELSGRKLQGEEATELAMLEMDIRSLVDGKGLFSMLGIAEEEIDDTAQRASEFISTLDQKREQEHELSLKRTEEINEEYEQWVAESITLTEQTTRTGEINNEAQKIKQRQIERQEPEVQQTIYL